MSVKLRFFKKIQNISTIRKILLDKHKIARYNIYHTTQIGEKTMKIEEIRNIHNDNLRIFKSHLIMLTMNIIRKKRTHRNNLTKKFSENSRKNCLKFAPSIALNPYYDCHEGQQSDVTNVSQTGHKYVTNASQICHKPVTNSHKKWQISSKFVTFFARITTIKIDTHSPREDGMHVWHANWRDKQRIIPN